MGKSAKLYFLPLCMALSAACSPSAPSQKSNSRRAPVTADTDSKAKDPENKDLGSGAGNPAIDPSFVPEDPNGLTAKASNDFPAVQLKLAGIPTGQSDFFSITIPVDADPTISHYAFKIDTPDGCKKGGGYKVETSKTNIRLALEKVPNGQIALCVIAYHFPTKRWQTPEEASVFAWEKTDFKRKITTYYEEFDNFCQEVLLIAAEIEFLGTSATYKWTRTDCEGEVLEGTDAMNIITNDQQAVTGFWNSSITGNSGGWFRFNWNDSARTSFSGTYGFGNPDEFVQGVWNSSDVAPQTGLGLKR